MREPTREEVEKALQSFCCNKVEKCHVDIIMALLEDEHEPIPANVGVCEECGCPYEDKPTPKWEEEYFNLTANGMPDDEAIEAFIREKLREMLDDCVHTGTAGYDAMKRKYGL